MNDIVPQTLVNFPAAPNRRAVLAFVALADAPDVDRISFHGDDDRIHLTFGTRTAADAWRQLLGMPEMKNTPRNPGWWTTHATIAGWTVHLQADEPDPHLSDPVDADTRGRLQQLLDPPPWDVS